MRLHKKIEKLSSPKALPHNKLVLNYYDDVVKSYLTQNADPNFIKRLMFDHDLDFPLFAQVLRQKIQYELILLNKINEIQEACGNHLEGIQNYDETILCILILGTDNGRLAILQNKTNLSETQEKYYNMILDLPAVDAAAKRIINADLALGWTERAAPNDFKELVKREISNALGGQKRVQGIDVIALRVLWAIAKRLQNGNPKLQTFLCAPSEKALQLMKNFPVLGRNVRICLKDENVKRLLGEFLLLLND
jgi:hypothetical protein